MANEASSTPVCACRSVTIGALDDRDVSATFVQREIRGRLNGVTP